MQRWLAITCLLAAMCSRRTNGLRLGGPSLDQKVILCGRAPCALRKRFGRPIRRTSWPRLVSGLPSMQWHSGYACLRAGVSLQVRYSPCFCRTSRMAEASPNFCAPPRDAPSGTQGQTLDRCYVQQPWQPAGRSPRQNCAKASWLEAKIFLERRKIVLAHVMDGKTPPRSCVEAPKPLILGTSLCATNFS